MYKVHRTKEGKNMFISQMDDSHLTNTIKFILRKIKICKDALGLEIKATKLQSALYRIDEKELASQAKEEITEICETMYPYLAEAMLRGISFTTELQDLLERKVAEKKFNIDSIIGLDDDDDIEQSFIDHDWEM